MNKASDRTESAREDVSTESGGASGEATCRFAVHSWRWMCVSGGGGGQGYGHPART